MATKPQTAVQDLNATLLDPPEVHFALMDMGILRGRPFRAWGPRIVGDLDDFLDQATDGAKRIDALASKISFRDAILGEIALTITTGLPVGAAEETLLLVIVALIGLKEESRGHHGGTLGRRDVEHSVEITRLNAGKHAAAQPLMQVRVRRQTLIRLLGMSNAGGSARRDLARRLDLLSRIVYGVKLLEGNRKVEYGGSSLLSYRIELDDDADTWIEIVLAERIARALLGKAAYVLPASVDPDAWAKSKVAAGRPMPGNQAIRTADKGAAQEALRCAENIVGMEAERQYDRIDLRERLALKSDLAQLLHSILSYRFPLQDARKRRSKKAHLFEKNAVRFDVLAGLLFPPGAVTKKTQQKRYERIRKALAEFAHLPGWEVEILSQSQAVQVSRWAVGDKTQAVDQKHVSPGKVVAND